MLVLPTATSDGFVKDVHEDSLFILVLTCHILFLFWAWGDGGGIKK
uniref:Transmembrane protein n=1 Tax=Anolis carolinensis TaxID=28377 RepID=A0A803TQK7_ANOCA